MRHPRKTPIFPLDDHAAPLVRAGQKHGTAVPCGGQGTAGGTGFGPDGVHGRKGGGGNPGDGLQHPAVSGGFRAHPCHKKPTHILIALAGALALAGTAAASEVRTRVYGEAQPAAADTRVVTREIAESLPPEAGVTPFALSLVPDVSLPPAGWSVVGLRLNLFAGRHRDVWGIDAGSLGNELTGKLTGLQAAGLWNRIGEAPAAIQSAGLANLCERDFCGIQTAAVCNWTGEEFTGIQAGLLNRAGGLAGLQAGLYNAADHGAGLQIGLVNTARVLSGVQIGLANFNAESPLRFFPVVNMAF